MAAPMQPAPPSAPPQPLGAPDDPTPFPRLFGAVEAISWLGPMLAALLVLISALPGLIRLPALDRDESRFAEATAQMLESGDFVNIRFQEEPRDKKPIGIHWMQAASVGMASSAEAREIWAYRLPSLLGAMGAAAACAWGAAGFWGRKRGALAGAALGASLIVSTEAFISATDAALCGAVALSLAALGRLYGAARSHKSAERDAPAIGTAMMFWTGQAVAVLLKGPVGPMVAGLTLGALWALDREISWAKRLRWGWGVLLLLAVVGPWAVAITVATDGSFWTRAVEGDLAPKLARGHEGHGAPPGLHLLLSPVLLFPTTALLPAALVAAWRRRGEPGVRFAVAWLAPSWLVFELLPTKLAHYTLPLYGALAWLAAAALDHRIGPISRRAGAALSLAVGLALAVAALAGTARFGEGADWAWATATALLYASAGIAGAVGVLRLGLGTEANGRIAASALALGIAAHMAITGGLAPALRPLWTSSRAARMVEATGLDPRGGVVAGPVAVAGYAEPSLVFGLGTQTALGSPADAAQATADGQPVLVEHRQDTAYRAALAKLKARAQPVGEVKGFNYSSGKPADLVLYKPLPSPEPPVVAEPRP